MAKYIIFDCLRDNGYLLPTILFGIYANVSIGYEVATQLYSRNHRW